MTPLYPPMPLGALWPEIILVLAACGVLLLSQARSPRLSAGVNWLALWSIVAAAIVVWLAPQLLRSEADVVAGGGLVFDTLAGFVRISTLVLGLLLVLVAWSLPRASERAEFLAMLLLALVGLLLVGPADDLLTLFLALELVSIPTYILVALSRSRGVGAEAATKYFYLGALSAALLAYGFSFLYGVAGTTHLSAAIPAVTEALAAPGTLPFGLASIGIVLAIAGLLFKLAAVPLHFYIADVYQGAASPVAGLLGFVPKFAGLVGLLKVLTLTGWHVQTGVALYWLLWIVAALSMTVGNVLALRQTNVKRLLGYSGIAHSGYMLVGVLAGPLGGGLGGGLMGDGVAAVLFYALIYGIANLGAFAVLGLLRTHGRPCETLRDLAGLVRRHPGLALLIVLAMFTLMGLPPTPGFWGKLSLFGSALAAAQQLPAPQSSWLVGLVVLALLNSALAAAYYLRVIAAVLLYENDQPAVAMPRDAHQMGALLCGLLLLIFTFRPADLIAHGRRASGALRQPVVVQPLAEAPPGPTAAATRP